MILLLVRRFRFLRSSRTRLFFKFRSETHGLNEELGRHRGREKKCVLCWDECESVCHILWECPAYSSIIELNFC